MRDAQTRTYEITIPPKKWVLRERFESLVNANGQSNLPKNIDFRFLQIRLAIGIDRLGFVEVYKCRVFL